MLKIQAPEIKSPNFLDFQTTWGKIRGGEKGDHQEKREIYWQRKTSQQGKELKLEVEEIGQYQENIDWMAGEDNPGGKGLKPLGRSKITGSEVNLKYSERVQDSGMTQWLTMQFLQFTIHLTDVKPTGTAGIWESESIKKKSNYTPKSENQNVAVELQPEKVQTSFLISGWMIARSLGEKFGGIISFRLLKNLPPGRVKRSLIRLSALSLSRSSRKCWSQKGFHVLLVGFSSLLTGKFLSQQGWCLKSKAVASGERDGVIDLGYLFPFQTISARQNCLFLLAPGNSWRIFGSSDCDHSSSSFSTVPWT